MYRAVFASLVSLSLAAACGASTSSPGAPSSATAATRASSSPSASASTSASSAAPSSSGASASSTTDPCTLVTKSDAEKVVGTVNETPKQTAATLPAVAERGSVCVYTGTAGLLTVGLATKATTSSEFDSIARQVPGVQPISGLGDSAYGTSAGASGASGATILVLKGSTYLSLSATSSSSSGDPLLNSLKSVAQTAAGKL